MPAKKHTKIIGIIGGAGISASIEMMHRFERYFLNRGATQNQDHPEILFYQATQAPSRSMFLEGRGESFVPAYVSTAKKLKQAGASFLCMSCNTAHYAIDEISAKADVQIINMVSETLKYIETLGNVTKIGIICSEGSAKQKIFDKYLSDVLTIYPDSEQQIILNYVINEVKLGRYAQNEDLIRKINIVTNSNDFRYCSHIIIGCTELSLALNGFKKPGHWVDSLDILVYNASKLYIEGIV